MKPRVVLYNPRAVFYTMPLALIAIASALDRTRYDVVIVDARIEADPLGRLMRELVGAVCLGVTVLTGDPIVDALATTRAVKEPAPEARSPHRERSLVRGPATARDRSPDDRQPALRLVTSGFPER